MVPCVRATRGLGRPSLDHALWETIKPALKESIEEWRIVLCAQKSRPSSRRHLRVASAVPWTSLDWDRAGCFGLSR